MSKTKSNEGNDKKDLRKDSLTQKKDDKSKKDKKLKRKEKEIRFEEEKVEKGDAESKKIGKNNNNNEDDKDQEKKKKKRKKDKNDDDRGLKEEVEEELKKLRGESKDENQAEEGEEIENKKIEVRDETSKPSAIIRDSNGENNNQGDGKKNKKKKEKSKKEKDSKIEIEDEVQKLNKEGTTTQETQEEEKVLGGDGSQEQEVGDSNDQDQKKKDKKRKKKEKSQKEGAEEGPNSKKSKTDNGDHSEDQKPETNKVESTLKPEEIDQFILKNKITYDPVNISSQFPPALRFEDVNVNQSLRKAFQNFKTPSPIQSAVWPVLMSGKDVIGIAETGSGKTLAFALPALQHILDDRKTSNQKSEVIKVLVIAPTRELAMQTESTVSELGKLVSPQANSLCVFGGVDKSSQRKALSGGGRVQIVAGTPGRLLDLANEGHLKLNHVSYLVLDEADRMLDKGFENDIRAIIGLCRPSRSDDGKKTRLTAMFSATWPMSVRRLASDFMFEPVRVLVGDDELTASCSVEQSVEVLEDSRGKEWKLLKTLNELKESSKGKKPIIGSKDKVIVFALYKKEAQRIHQFLIRKGFQVCCIEGDMSQDKRTKSLEDFKSGKATILVATDVAARGLDIPKVEVVINVTFPLTIEDYIHRIGRTGRAGRKGRSITFFTDDDKSHAGELMRVLKEANQTVPEDLKQWGGQIKKKSHAAYGDHYREIDPTVKAKKIKFD